MMPNRLIYLILFLCLLSANSIAQKFSQVDEWLNKNTSLMGGRSVLIIYKDGKLIYEKSTNEMSTRQKFATRFIAKKQGKVADTDDFTAATRLPIASCSKWLSVALVMCFVDDGKLSLSDSVGKFLPILTQNGKGNITIKQCLSHTTGIKAPPLKENLAEMKELTDMSTSIAQIAQLPMEGAPGKVFHYSNTGLQIAGAILEKISGKNFETLFAERIAAPLQMQHTDFGKGKIALPAGGAISTPEDYCKFLLMLLQKGMYAGNRVLSEKSIDEMQQNQINQDVTIASSPKEAGEFGYGFGEWIMTNTRNQPSATGICSPGLFGSFPWLDNEKKYVGFLLSYNLNAAGRGERYKELKSIIDQSIR